MSIDTLGERILELVERDKELHDALQELIEAKAEAARELAAWRRRRK